MAHGLLPEDLDDFSNNFLKVCVFPVPGPAIINFLGASEFRILFK